VGDPRYIAHSRFGGFGSLPFFLFLFLFSLGFVGARVVTV